MSKVTKVCVICGKTFSVFKSNEERYTTCGSTQCRSIYRSGSKSPFWKGGRKIKIKCSICGLEFETFKSRKNTRKVCHNPDCLRKIRSINLKGKQQTPEHIENMRKTKIGVKFTKEHCQHISESKQGDKSPQWQGGISFEPYCPKFNNNFRRRVRAFFNYTCILCGKKESGSRGHSVHHVHYNKESCCGGPEIFVLLCPNCHGKTNYPTRRNYWIQYFEEIIAIQYGGKCYLTKEEFALIKS